MTIDFGRDIAHVDEVGIENELVSIGRVIAVERRKGYGKLNLYMGLIEEQKLGVKRVKYIKFSLNIFSSFWEQGLLHPLKKDYISKFSKE